jgi:hypothetical protein
VQEFHRDPLLAARALDGFGLVADIAHEGGKPAS